jgi:hypothetical protein
LSDVYCEEIAAEEAILDRIAASESESEEPLAEAEISRKGRRSLGRPKKINARGVARWRRTNDASIARTAEHFGISPRAVAKACAEHAEAVRVWTESREDQEWQELEAASEWLIMKMRRLHEASEQAEAAMAKYKDGSGIYSDYLDASAEVRFWANSLGAFDTGRDRLWR